MQYFIKTPEFVGERILKIAQHVAKIWATVQQFFDSQCICILNRQTGHKIQVTAECYSQYDTIKLEKYVFRNTNCTQAAEIDLDLQTRPSEGSNMSSCKFVANPFSGSRDISYTNKKVRQCQKTEPYAVHCVLQLVQPKNLILATWGGENYDK